MNVRYLIDGIFHACVYSHIPLLILQQNQRFFLVNFIDTPDRAASRWLVHDGLFSISGYSNCLGFAIATFYGIWNEIISSQDFIPMSSWQSVSIFLCYYAFQLRLLSFGGQMRIHF